MRLFFALWPDPDVRRGLAGWGDALRARVRGRPTRAENLHATLAFLGEVNPADAPRLDDIAAALEAPAFDLVLDGLHYWPHNGIVYAACSRTPQPLAALALALQTRLVAAGFPVDTRAYVPHVTLLRAVRRPPPDIPVSPLLWRVNDIVLVESARAEGVLTYRPIRRFTLTN